MMITQIFSNADMPKSLNSDWKQDMKAKQVVSTKYSAKVKRTRAPSLQGFYSRTRIVTLANSTEIVVQFRIVQLDLIYMRRAREKLGYVVPQVEHIPDRELEEKGIWIYLLSFITGKLWDAGDDEGPGNVVTAKSIARILARGQVDGDVAAVVDNKLRPKLQLLQRTTLRTIKPLRKNIEMLLSNVDKLKKLPLFISHFDLNKTNILVGEDGEVTGIVDWELASDSPFGVGLHRIHDMAGFVSKGRFIMPANFEETERGFWDVMFSSVSPATRDILEKNLESVQLALRIGLIVFYLLPTESDEINEPSEDEVNLLLKFLTYRLPLQRGNNPPYTF